jgi:hypothetical protein
MQEGARYQQQAQRRPSDVTHDKGPAPLIVGVLGRPDVVYHVPHSRVFHVPRELDPSEHVVLCPAFALEDGVVDYYQYPCEIGAACPFVHADVRGLAPVRVHINYAWRELDDVIYPRFPVGMTLEVAPPNSRKPTDVMDSGCVLITGALASSRRPLAHCAHYYLNRQCNLGARCRFIHAVYIDPAANGKRRAPAPVQLGRPMGPRPKNRNSEDEWCRGGNAATHSSSSSASPCMANG